MDSGGITVKRTGAATAVAAKYLARPDSTVVTVCGCGTQARIQLQALQQVIPIERINAYSIDEDEAADFCVAMSAELGIQVTRVADPGHAVRHSDVCVTCTPSRAYFLDQSYVSPGTLVAAVGADSPEKQEIDPRLLAANTVVVDLLDQCVAVGELHHAIEAGLMTAADVRAELGDVVAGRASGRSSDDEIVVFDSTGTALQDAAAAVLAYERAVASGRGTRFDFV
jgi:ornithine cyclodeaminase/alanine dehydrogenase